MVPFLLAVCASALASDGSYDAAAFDGELASDDSKGTVVDDDSAALSGGGWVMDVTCIGEVDFDFAGPGAGVVDFEYDYGHTFYTTPYIWSPGSIQNLCESRIRSRAAAYCRVNTEEGLTTYTGSVTHDYRFPIAGSAWISYPGVRTISGSCEHVGIIR